MCLGQLPGDVPDTWGAACWPTILQGPGMWACGAELAFSAVLMSTAVCHAVPREPSHGEAGPAPGGYSASLWVLL